MGKTGKIFIIEDEPNFLEEAIEDTYHWQISNYGYDAIDKAIIYQPDLIILEGSFKGLALCHAIRNNPTLKETKLVILSEEECIVEQTKAFRAGANEVVSKPFSADELLDILEGLITNRCLIDSLTA
jgi:DNA-binding response OmpR family regulator